MTDARPSLRFPRSHRLSHDLEFQRVFEGQVRHATGPLVIYGRPNGLTHPRLGLTISRRIGGAVRRNRLKRLLRESFRLDRAAWPGAYDLVIVARPHRMRSLDDYRALLTASVGSIHEQWMRTSPSRATTAEAAPPPAE